MSLALGTSMTADVRWHTGRESDEFGPDAGRCKGKPGRAGTKIGPPAKRWRRIWLAVAVGLAAAVVQVGPTLAEPSAAAAITECDRLAASPDDPGREGPGVPFDKIDAPPAIER